MDLLPVLFIIIAIVKAMSKSGKSTSKKSSIHQILGAAPNAKTLPPKPAMAPKPATGEEIQARKRALQEKYAQQLEVKKAQMQARDSEPQAVTAGAFGSIAALQPVEGVDPCHDELYDKDEALAPLREQADGWEPDFSFDRQSVVQAVVMQEILTRPCQRQRRGFR